MAESPNKNAWTPHWKISLTEYEMCSGKSCNLQKIIRKSKRSLEVAQKLLEEGHFDFSSSRSYYSAFYCMEAALLIKGLTYSKHSAVIGAFNREFIKTRVFPHEFSSKITQLSRERQEGGYDFEERITAEEAAQNLEFATEIHSAVCEYLVKWEQKKKDG